jgi:8-oxo-dGTP diphosphatase
MTTDHKKHIVAITAFIKNNSGDKFLILKRSMSELAFPGLWAFPGGKLERGENFLTTLKREVQEEVGLEIEDYKEFLKDFTFIRSDGNNVVGMCFVVKAKSENVVMGHGFDEFAWVTPEEFLKLNYIEGMEEEVDLAFKLHKP